MKLPISKTTFSKGDSTHWSYKRYTIIEIIHETVPSYRIKNQPERYEENLLIPPISSLEENEQFMEELNIVQ